MQIRALNKPMEPKIQIQREGKSDLMVDRYTDYYFNPKPCVERLRRSPVSVLYTVKQTRKQGASCKQVTKSVEGNLVSRS